MSNFSKNVKYLREHKKLSQNKLAELANVNQTTIARWENEEISPSLDNIVDLANALSVSVAELVGYDLNFDNGEIIDLPKEFIKIPVYGAIKAGIAMEAQTDIIDYIDIPKDMVKNGKQFYGLKIKGDSMYPDYKENDIVIFENTNDMLLANGKDCAVMINSTECTFKKVKINPSGIQLIPINLNNSDGYEPTFYDGEQVADYPIRIVGIAKKISRDV